MKSLYRRLSRVGLTRSYITTTAETISRERGLARRRTRRRHLENRGSARIAGEPSRPEASDLELVRPVVRGVKGPLRKMLTSPESAWDNRADRRGRGSDARPGFD